MRRRRERKKTVTWGVFQPSFLSRNIIRNFVMRNHDQLPSRNLAWISQQKNRRKTERIPIMESKKEEKNTRKAKNANTGLQHRLR